MTKSLTDDLLTSEQVYISIFIRTGKWRVREFPSDLVAFAQAERAKHKAGCGGACFACTRATLILAWGGRIEELAPVVWP